MKKSETLQGHAAIVTGASGGIGFQFCRELARRGANVVLTDIDAVRLETSADALKKEFPSVDAIVFVADLTEPGISEKFEAFCKEKDIEPDILINNAGIFSFAPLTETSPRKVDCFVDLHVRAVTELSRWFVARRQPKGSGWLLNMSSMSCWMPMPGLGLYAATKAYIRVFTRSLHYEARESGVGVTVACPGGIATDLFGLPKNLQRFAVRIGALDTPERFARNAVKRMLRKRKQYINGWLNKISIVFVAMMPTPVRMTVKHRMLDKGIKR